MKLQQMLEVTSTCPQLRRTYS